MDEQLRMQDQIAQAMKKVRYQHGALDLETIEPEAVLKDGSVVDLRLDPEKPGQRIDRRLHDRGQRSRRPVSRREGLARAAASRALCPRSGTPFARWPRSSTSSFPAKADSQALSDFLTRRRAADPLRFPDLSLTIVKLLGRGEYVVQLPGQQGSGHFGLAVQDYSHSTAPNRRFPDLITQRLLKAVLSGGKLPYNSADLTSLATHCTEQEDAAAKVERQVRKSAAAQLLSDRVGKTFDAIVTGAASKGTWVRVLKPPVEGKLVRGESGAQSGRRTSRRACRRERRTRFHRLRPLEQMTTASVRARPDAVPGTSTKPSESAVSRLQFSDRSFLRGQRAQAVGFDPQRAVDEVVEILERV